MNEIYPRVYILEKDTEYQYGSDATEVDNILQEIYALRGEKLSHSIRLEFEYHLSELLDYVTLIGYEIMPNVCKLKKRPEDFTKDENILVYYYNEDMVRILGLQFMEENARTDLSLINDLLAYKFNCVENNRCVVYTIDDTYGERVFELNYELSNLEYIIPEDLKMSIDY